MIRRLPSLLGFSITIIVDPMYKYLMGFMKHLRAKLVQFLHEWWTNICSLFHSLLILSQWNRKRTLKAPIVAEKLQTRMYSLKQNLQIIHYFIAEKKTLIKECRKKILTKSTILSLRSCKLWKLLPWLLTIAIPTRTIIPREENLVEKKNLFSFYDGYQNLQYSTT
jgi:hypothetical protein